MRYITLVTMLLLLSIPLLSQARYNRSRGSCRPARRACYGSYYPAYGGYYGYGYPYGFGAYWEPYYPAPYAYLPVPGVAFNFNFGY